MPPPEAGPLSAAPLSVAPLSAAPLSAAPLSAAPLSAEHFSTEHLSADERERSARQVVAAAARARLKSGSARGAHSTLARVHATYARDSVATAASAYARDSVATAALAAVCGKLGEKEAESELVTVLVSSVEPKLIDSLDTFPAAVFGHAASRASFAVLRNPVFTIVFNVAAVGGVIALALQWSGVREAREFALACDFTTLVIFCFICVTLNQWITLQALQRIDTWFFLCNVGIVGTCGGAIYEDPWQRLSWRVFWMALQGCVPVMDAYPSRTTTRVGFISGVSLSLFSAMAIFFGLFQTSDIVEPFLGGKISYKNRTMAALGNLCAFNARFLYTAVCRPTHLVILRGCQILRCKSETAARSKLESLREAFLLVGGRPQVDTKGGRSGRSGRASVAPAGSRAPASAPAPAAGRLAADELISDEEADRRFAVALSGVVESLAGRASDAEISRIIVSELERQHCAGRRSTALLTNLIAERVAEAAHGTGVGQDARVQGDHGIVQRCSLRLLVPVFEPVVVDQNDTLGTRLGGPRLRRAIDRQRESRTGLALALAVGAGTLFFPLLAVTTDSSELVKVLAIAFLLLSVPIVTARLLALNPASLWIIFSRFDSVFIVLNVLIVAVTGWTVFPDAKGGIWCSQQLILAVFFGTADASPLGRTVRRCLRAALACYVLGQITVCLAFWFQRLELIDYKIAVVGRQLSAKEWWFSSNINLAVVACRWLYRSWDLTSFLVIEGVRWVYVPLADARMLKASFHASSRAAVVASEAQSARQVVRERRAERDS